MKYFGFFIRKDLDSHKCFLEDWAKARMRAESLQLCLTLCDPWTVAHQAPLTMGFSRQEYWNGLLLPPPGDLPDPGIEPASLTSPALAGRFFTTSTTWEAWVKAYFFEVCVCVPRLSEFFGIVYLSVFLLPLAGDKCYALRWQMGTATQNLHTELRVLPSCPLT